MQELIDSRLRENVENAGSATAGKLDIEKARRARVGSFS